MTDSMTPDTEAGRALLVWKGDASTGGTDYHAGFCDALIGGECSCELPQAVLEIERQAAALADVAGLREAGAALDLAIGRWVDRHYTMEYPFQLPWQAFHRALYGHDRKPLLSPCATCAAEGSGSALRSKGGSR